MLTIKYQTDIKVNISEKNKLTIIKSTVLHKYDSNFIFQKVNLELPLLYPTMVPCGV